MNLMAKQVLVWVYPANQPSVVPFRVRRALANLLLLPALLSLHRCEVALKRWGWL